MKRTVPLLITAIGGIVLIVSFFVPFMEGWGEVTAIWFDILAAIAFLLGGGNLIKMHLKKCSDRAAGWGYSAVTIAAFLLMLFLGLFKVGSPPAVKQEYYGEAFAPLTLADFPDSQVTEIAGTLPEKGDGTELPPSVRRQLTQKDGNTLAFRGWMLPHQKADLIKYKGELQWQCTIEKLFEKSQPKAPLKGKVAYYYDHQALAFKGYMTDEHKKAVLALAQNDNTAWKEAVERLSGNPTLLVGETSNFLEQGGGISFYRVSTKIRFRLALKETRRKGLKASAKLLQVAQVTN